MDDTYSTSGHIPGSILLDGFLQSFAQGIILMQYIKYWNDYRDDTWRKRAFVATVNVLVLLQTILEDYKVWRLAWNDELWWMRHMQWSDFLVNGLICSLCEAFFVQRCWKITNKNVCILLSLSSLTLSVFVADIFWAIGVQKVGRQIRPGENTLHTSLKLYPSTIVAFTYWAFGSLALNLSITTILIVCLWKARVGLQDSDKILYHIMAATWESAAPPSLFTLISVAIYHVSLDSNYHLVRFFAFMTGKLYAIGLLRTLNLRARLRDRMRQSRGIGRVSLDQTRSVSTFRVSAATGTRTRTSG